MTSTEIRDKAKNLLENTDIDVLVGDAKIISILEDLKNYESNDLKLAEKTLNNIENYLITKSKMIIQNEDYEYLKKVAKDLREQQVRIEDQEPFSSPIFNLPIDEYDNNKKFEFITRPGVDEFMEYNSTTLRHLHTKNRKDNSSERRKEQLYSVNGNRNLQLEKLIDIIKRNY